MKTSIIRKAIIFIGVLMFTGLCGAIFSGCDEGRTCGYTWPASYVTITDETGTIMGGDGDDWCPANNTVPPTYFAFYPAYPNPFNGTTIIRFALPVACHVDIGIYTFYNSRVATLMDHYIPAGHHEVEWNATDVANGIYYCRIKAGDFECEGKLFVYNVQ